MALQNPLSTSNSASLLSELKSRKEERKMRPAPILPVLPPLAPRRQNSYPLAVQQAPFTALRAMLVFEDEPTPHQVTPKCRLRTQVGSTNRWRLPATLGSDLLGINQAIRAIRQNVSKSVSSQKKSFEGATGHVTETPQSSPKRSTSLPPAAPLPRTAAESLTALPSPNRKFPSTNRKSVAPLAIQPFLYKTSKTEFKFGRHGNKVCTGVADTAPADVLLECLGEVWELHRPFLQKSVVLSKLLKAADLEEERREDLESVKSSFIPLDSSACVKLELQIGNDAWITKKALAIALSKLYEQDMNFVTGSGTVDASVVVGVLGAALTLEFADLSGWCQNHMMEDINSTTVCLFHQGAIRYRLSSLAMACERWLCLHLIPTLSRSIFIKHLQSATLQLILKSSKLFVTTEWQVYKALCIWLYLQLNPKQDILPAWTTIVSYFANYTGSDFIMPSPVKTITRESQSARRFLPPEIASSLSSTRISATPFLETEEGQNFTPLFHALRLHGITNAANIQDVIQMNVIPQRWLLQTLHSHYKALQGRHSPPLLFNNPISDSIRIGFIINNPSEVKETFLLHGFHFGIHLSRAENSTSSNWSFSLERLRPSDLTLNAPPLANQTVSMKHDREVNYYVQVTMMENNSPVIVNTGFISHIFTLGDQSSRRKEVVMTQLSLPLYVMFAICLPP